LSALAELERVQGAVAAQRERVAELDRARSDGARRVERARARLLDFYRERERLGAQVGEGIALELPEGTEAELVEELRQAEGGLQLRAAVIPFGDGLSDVRLASVDQRAEAMHAGAVEALGLREGELREFIRDNLPALAAERVPLARAVQGRAAAALEEARGAAAAHERERSWWARTLSAAGMESLLQEMPENELAWSSQAGTPGMPLPGSFIG
jgi:hypothetical protein